MFDRYYPERNIQYDNVVRCYCYDDKTALLVYISLLAFEDRIMLRISKRLFFRLEICMFPLSLIDVYSKVLPSVHTVDRKSVV